MLFHAMYVSQGELKSSNQLIAEKIIATVRYSNISAREWLLGANGVEKQDCNKVTVIKNGVGDIPVINFEWQLLSLELGKFGIGWRGVVQNITRMSHSLSLSFKFQTNHKKWSKRLPVTELKKSSQNGICAHKHMEVNIISIELQC